MEELMQRKTLYYVENYTVILADRIARKLLRYKPSTDADQINKNVSYEHSLRVSHTAYQLALHLIKTEPSKYASDLPQKALVAGLLHDLGKSEMLDIVNKKENLTAEEWAILITHPEHSLRIINECCPDISPDIKEACLCHHLKLDGSGYPDCAKKHSISILTQILTICDIYDAIRHPRSYKPENTLEKSLQIMRTQDVAEGKLNAELFAAFEKIIVMYEKSALHDKKIMVEEVK